MSGVAEERGAASKPQRIAPATAAEVADLLRGLDGTGRRARIRGAGTELPTGNVGELANVVLATDALAGIEELDADEGVARVLAGTPVAALRAAAHAEGLELPLDPPSPRSTVGGALAAAALGPRCTGFGRVRDAVLGLDVVLASGERTRCGGRVVKNVTGYDLAKLYVGSHGTLGVLTAAWLRLRPRPEAVRVLAAALSARDALEAALAAARHPAARAAALVDAARVPALHAAAQALDAAAQALDAAAQALDAAAHALAATAVLPAVPSDAALLVVELAGDAPVVDEGAAALVAAHGAREVSATVADALAALEGAADDARFAGALRLRVTARPSRLAAACAPLRAAGAALVVHPALSLVQACVMPGARGAALGPDDLDRAWTAAATAARAGEGHALLADAPAALRAGRDVFGPRPAAFPLLERLRRGFDPNGVLVPGCFVGGL